jgi:magnesium-transporting ATPase (P-type)
MVKKTSNSVLVIIAIVGFILSFIWENLHFPLYQSYADWMVQISFLFCALGDIILIFLVYFLTAALFKDLFWLTKLHFKKMVVTLTISIIISLVAEKAALLLGWWQYNDQMPVILILDIGLSPFLAISLLPIITFIASKKINQIF